MNKAKYPFRLVDAFFTSLQFARVPDIPEPLHLDIPVEIRVHAEKYPKRFQIDLRMHSVSEEPFNLSIEVVGIYELVNTETNPDLEVLQAFIEERAVFTLWAHASQIIRTITGQMGMNPIKVANPYTVSTPELLPEELRRHTD